MSFYAQELQKVTVKPDTTFIKDKTVDVRGSGRRKQVLVRWRGYSPKFDTWISSSNINYI